MELNTNLFLFQIMRLDVPCLQLKKVMTTSEMSTYQSLQMERIGMNLKEDSSTINNQ
jgi:hypothetical protein